MKMQYETIKSWCQNNDELLSTKFIFYAENINIFLTHWTRLSLSTGVWDFSIPACYLSLGSESCLNLPIIS